MPKFLGGMDMLLITKVTEAAGFSKGTLHRLLRWGMVAEPRTDRNCRHAFSAQKVMAT